MVQVLFDSIPFYRGLLLAHWVKNLSAIQVTQVQSLSWEDPLEKYFCLENSHEQRSLTGYSPWDHKEADMTEGQSSQCIIQIPTDYMIEEVEIQRST